MVLQHRQTLTAPHIGGSPDTLQPFTRPLPYLVLTLSDIRRCDDYIGNGQQNQHSTYPEDDAFGLLFLFLFTYFAVQFASFTHSYILLKG